MRLPAQRLVFVFKCHVLRARFRRDMIGLKSFMLFNSLLVIGHERCQFLASTCQAVESTEPSSQTENDSTEVPGVYFMAARHLPVCRI